MCGDSNLKHGCDDVAVNNVISEICLLSKLVKNDGDCNNIQEG